MRRLVPRLVLPPEHQGQILTDQCSSCLFGQTTDPLTHSRLCRRNAPPFAAGPYALSVWPVVEDTDWCGEGADMTTKALYGVAGAFS